jgi:glutamine amidotransferase
MFAIERLGFKAVLSKIHEIKAADKVIFPEWERLVKCFGKWFGQFNSNIKTTCFRICLGMQLMCNASEEGIQKAWVFLILM